MSALLLALLIGVVSGLRTFTGPAAVMLARGGIWGIILAVAAVLEYIADALPKAPSRTVVPAVVLRSLSGAFAGAIVASTHGASGIAGAIIGTIGALIGTYGGHAVRLAAIERVSAIPAAIGEDIVAIGLALLAATR